MKWDKKKGNRNAVSGGNNVWTYSFKAFVSCHVLISALLDISFHNADWDVE